VLVLLKLWLVEFFPVVATLASHDELLFVRQAASILGGEWLGRYSESTLVKGPFYPLFIAGVNSLGIPLQLAQHLLYAGACAAAVLALKPYLARRASSAWALLSFALLFFNPYTFAYTAVLRFAIYPALTLLVFASAFGLLSRIELGRGRPWLWSVLLGLSLAAFWHTREEGVWILSPLALLVGFSLLLAIHRGRPLPVTLGLLAAPLVLWSVASASIALVNRSHYGMAMVNELRSSDFRAAYGALLRIEAGEPRRFYPVTRAARARAYEASPSFRELRPIIEGSRGRSWIEAGHHDFAFSLFLFVLRDAVEQTGYYRDAPTAMAFYRRVGDELHAACDSGELTCRRSALSRLNPLIPPSGPEHHGVYAPSFAQTIARWVLFEEHPVHEDLPFSAVYRRPMGSADPATRGLYETVTKGHVAPATDDMIDALPAFMQHRVDRRTGLLTRIHSVYRGLMRLLVVASIIVFVVSLAISALRRRLEPLALLAFALLLGILSLGRILALMQVFTHPEIWRPMQTGFPLVILFVVVTGTLTWRTVRPLAVTARDGT
jgi:hypothetical protein